MRYVILMGDAGAGKSTLVEKVTGKKGRSSASSTSATRASALFKSVEADEKGSFIICDTPGTNSATERFQHNLHIAHALNFQPVNLILIVVKADTRIETVLDRVGDYMGRFLPEDLPEELLGLCITHMDQVNWTAGEVTKHLNNNFGIKSVITASYETQGHAIARRIGQRCSKTPHRIHVDSEMFLKLFKIQNNNLKVLRETKREVARFEKMKICFFQELPKITENEKGDLIFEFQAWMREEIIESQKRISNSNNFTFCNDANMAIEAGHIANLTNQLREILRYVRIAAMDYHKNVETDFRKCPYCGLVWHLVEGCDEDTTYGKRPLNHKWDGKSTLMAAFEFVWVKADEKLRIRRTGEIDRAQKLSGYFNQSPSRQSQQGCGKTIAWKDMKPVSVPQEFIPKKAITTDDVRLVPEQHTESWDRKFQKEIKGMSKLSVEN